MDGYVLGGQIDGMDDAVLDDIDQESADNKETERPFPES